MGSLWFSRYKLIAHFQNVERVDKLTDEIEKINYANVLIARSHVIKASGKL